MSIMNRHSRAARVRSGFVVGGCLVLVSLAGHLLTAADAPTPLTKTTHIYKTVGDVKIAADIYCPEGAEPRPVVVWIHGGALIMGSRNSVPKNILELCTREHLILVSIDYRLAPEVKLPEIAADLRDFFAWLHAEGPRLFHADTRRVVVSGGSAGGFLTMLSGAAIQPPPQALVAYWGYGDIDGKWAVSASQHHGQNTPADGEVAKTAVDQGQVLTNTDDPAVQKGRGLYYRGLRQTGTWSREVTGIDVIREPGKLNHYCPVKLIKPDYPPILMIHGTEDTDVPYSCSVDMARELKKHGVSHELISIPNAEHGLRDGDPKLIAQAQTRALEYILEHATGKPRAAAAIHSEVSAQLAAIAKVGPQGAGSAAARDAQMALSKRGVEILPELLLAMDTSNVVAANWYRIVFEDIVRREKQRPDVVWPICFMKEYISNANGAGRPRRMVLALIEEFEPRFTSQWMPTRLADPAFRHEAVSLALAAGDQALKAKDNDLAKSEFSKAFENARDSGQVVQAADKLKSLGVAPDVIGHLGLVIDWWLVGPFDAPERTGFRTVFEPENQVDLQAKYQGQGDAEIGWIRHQSTDNLGQLNLISALSQTREAVGYAYTEIDVAEEVAEEVQVQLGCGADDNCTVWLNGSKVLAREQWLNGTRFDRFVTPVKLLTGRNTLLVKVCQGPQHKDPEVQNNWSLQLRLCDNQGRGIPFQPLLRPVAQQK